MEVKIWFLIRVRFENEMDSTYRLYGEVIKNNSSADVTSITFLFWLVVISYNIVVKSHRKESDCPIMKSVTPINLFFITIH